MLFRDGHRVVSLLSGLCAVLFLAVTFLIIESEWEKVRIRRKASNTFILPPLSASETSAKTKDRDARPQSESSALHDENFVNNENFAIRKEAVEGATGRWRPIVGSKQMTFTFSAYYDQRRQPPAVVVLAGVFATSPEPVRCTFYGIRGKGIVLRRHNESKSESAFVEGKHHLNWETHGRNYTLSFVTCPLTERFNDKRNIPHFVRLLPSRNTVADVSSQDEGYRIPILNTNSTNKDQVPKQAEGLGICVKPIHSAYNDVRGLVEFIELYTVLGANGFTFYNLNASTAVNCVLRHYESQGTVEVFDWNLPWREEEIWEFGQLVTLNDCLYRNMWKYEYLALVDLDEYLIPRKHSDLLQLIKSVPKKASEVTNGENLLIPRHPKRNVGSFLFRNAFFLRDCPDVRHSRESNSSWSFPLVAREVYRMRNISRGYESSKYIVNPRVISNTGIHYVFEHLSADHESYLIPPQLALSHHYRSRPAGFCGNITSSDSKDRKALVVDKSALRFTKILFSKMNDVGRTMGNKCKLTDTGL